MPGSCLQRDGVGGDSGNDRDAEGSGETLSGGHAHPDARVQPGPDVDGHCIEGGWRPADLVEAEVDGRNEEGGMANRVDPGGGGQRSGILDQGNGSPRG